MEVIDDKVRRILRILFRFGFFDWQQTDRSIPLYHHEASRIALEGARQGIVLLKNQDNNLPLDRTRVKSIAVLGPNSYPAVTGGGGSSRVQPFRAISLLDGIVDLAGENIKVFYHPAIITDIAEITRSSSFLTLSPEDQLVSGLRGEYFANKELAGAPVFTRVDREINFRWTGSPGKDLPEDGFSVRWTGKIRTQEEGNYEFIIRADDGIRLYVEKKLVLDSWWEQAVTRKEAVVFLPSNSLIDITLEYFDSRGTAEIALGWRRKEEMKESEAVRLAARSDVAVVCVGFNAETEREGADRAFELPAEQEELINYGGADCWRQCVHDTLA